MFLKNAYNSFDDLFASDISVPRMLRSSMVPFGAIRTRPSFAAYPKVIVCSGIACNLKRMIGSFPGEICSMSSTQLQLHDLNLNKIFSKKSSLILGILESFLGLQSYALFHEFSFLFKNIMIIYIYYI